MVKNNRYNKLLSAEIWTPWCFFRWWFLRLGPFLYLARPQGNGLGIISGEDLLSVTLV